MLLHGHDLARECLSARLMEDGELRIVCHSEGSQSLGLLMVETDDIDYQAALAWVTDNNKLA